MAPRRFGVLSAVVAALSLVTLATYISRWAAILGFFWDVSVYQRAAHDLTQGVDPYRRDVLFPFVYHPLVLRALAFLNSLVPLQVLLPLFTLGALVWLFIEFSRAVKQPGALGVEQAGSLGPRSLGFGLLVAAGFGGIGSAALMSGNLSPMMHFALLAALLRAWSCRDRISHCLPYVLAVAFALFKPYLLIYLAIPVLLFPRRIVAVLSAVLATALFAGVWFTAARIWPAEYAHFVENLSWHMLSRGDVGYTFFYVFLSLTRKIPFALVLHTVVSGLVVVLVPLVFKQRYGPSAPVLPQVMLTYLALTLANPRMKDYDLFPALVGFFAVLSVVSQRPFVIMLVGVALAAVPGLTALVAPQLIGAHPAILDPYGNWQIIGLAVMAILVLVELLDETQRLAGGAEGVAAGRGGLD